jgi:hypothetical protein
MMLKKVLSLITGDTSTPVVLKMPKGRPFKKYTERELIQLESRIGAQLFGELPKGRRREFFCLDANTWIWHEEGTDLATGKSEQMTIRYEVHDKGVLKVQEGARYSYIEGAELENLRMATKLYYERVAREVYRRDTQTGQKLA